MLFRYRGYDDKEPANGAYELLNFLGENDKGVGPDQVFKMIEEVGFWNENILNHQSKNGRFICHGKGKYFEVGL